MSKTQTTCCLLMFALVVAACDQGPSTGPTPPTTGQPPVTHPRQRPEYSWQAPCRTPRGDGSPAPEWRSSTVRRLVCQRPPTPTASFASPGAFDETTQFRATKEGHGAAMWALPPICPQCNPNWWLHFSLEALAPHADLAGDYTLTAIAAQACDPGLPEDAARERTRRARQHPCCWIQRTRGSSSRSSDARFVERYNSFTIGLAGDYLASRTR